MDSQKALEWLTDVLAVNGRTLTMKDTRMSVSEWDSLGALLLLSRLEEDYGIILSADEVDKVDSVKEILEMLEKNSVLK